MNKYFAKSLMLLAFSTALSGLFTSSVKAEVMPSVSSLASDYITLTPTTEATHSGNYIVLYDVDKTSWTITPKYYDLTLNRTDYTYQTGEKTLTYDIGLPETVTITAGYTTSDERLDDRVAGFGPEINDVLIAEKTTDVGGAITLWYSWMPEGIVNNGVFIGNSATVHGGAIHTVYGALGEGILNSVFIGNSSTYAGAIGNQEYISEITNSAFIANSATEGGGAAIYMYNESYMGSINNSAFIGNSAVWGAAIGGNPSSNAKIEGITGSLFLANIAAKGGGAIYVNKDMTLGDIENSNFIANVTNANGGGAIYNATNGTMGNIINSNFVANRAKFSGGAVASNPGTLGSIIRSNFISNISDYLGGAFATWAVSGDIEDSNFISNTAVYGGAIILANDSTKVGDILRTNFINNSAELGGAIYNSSGNIEGITNSVFVGNSADDQGGAIYNEDDISVIGNIKNSTFLNNTAGSQGGAIYSPNDILITSDAGTTTFQGNTANGESNAIYMDNAAKTLTFDIKNGGTTYMYDGIDGAEGYSVVFKGANKAADTVHLFNDVKNANVSIGDVKLNMVNNDAHQYSLKSLNLTGSVDMAVDVDLENVKMDHFGTSDMSAAAGSILNVNAFNIVADDNYGDFGGTTSVAFIDAAHADMVSKGTDTAISDLYRYSVSFNDGTGEFEFTRAGIAPKHQESGERAAAASSNTQNSVDAMNTKLVNREVNRNLLSVRGISSGDDMIVTTWAEAFGSKNDVKLKNLPGAIDTTFYGVMGGLDSKKFMYDNGVQAIYGLYGAYVVSKQKYGQSRIDQTGEYLGASVAFRKGIVSNTFAGNVGYLHNEAKTAYGTDKFEARVVSISDKVEVDLENGSWTYTPALYVGYTGIDSDDYTTKARTKIENHFMHVFTIAPELKVTKDFGVGLDGYAKVAYKMFFYGNNKVRANGVLLPGMSAKPYIEYGIGLKKDWSQEEWSQKDITSYAELTRHDGGREGWDVNLGLKLDF